MGENCKNRVRIKDIAEQLNVSTATVSNVINGKTKKISIQTIQRVQEALEKNKYVPNMPAVLLSQNNSKIICIVIADHDKYEGKVLQDPFVYALIDNLQVDIEESNLFMMIKKCSNVNEIVKYASMWNMSGLVLVGFCEQDYNNLRRLIRIPFVVMDGFFTPDNKCANISIDDFQGGYKMGQYLIKNGHRRILYMSDNDLSMDHARYMGLKKALTDNNIREDSAKLEIVPLYREQRYLHYQTMKERLNNFTAIFCASDAYAIEIMNFLIDCGYKIPEDISIAGFDDISEATIVRPALTTIRQDIKLRAHKAIEFLKADANEDVKENNIILPVELIERNSIKKM